MEFFRIINAAADEKEIRDKISIENLNNIVSDIFTTEIASEFAAEIGGVWGEFTLKYDRIKGGVRFYLVECPNALAWTITTGYPPERDKIVLHCTINRTRKDKAFLEEIEEFLDDWEKGIKEYFTG